MKTLLILFLTLLCLSFSRTHNSDLKYNASKEIDSIIIHKLDGKTSEWPEEKFSVNEEAEIKYAIDHDTQNLYLALKIKNELEQIKMIRMGMNIYIDLKAKKRENMGIEFPLKSEQGTDPQQANTIRGKFDLQSAKMMYGLNLLSLRLFGFTNAEPVKQGLETQGSVNIAYSWDSTYLMQVEYLVPLNLLGGISSLNQKEVSIGFNVNGLEMPTSNLSAASTSVQARPSSGRGRTPNTTIPATGSNSSVSPGSGKMMNEQKFWTKYTFYSKAD